MVVRNQIKPELQEDCHLCQHHLPAKNSYADNFPALLTQTITITTSSDSKAPSTLQIALHKPLAVDLKYSVPPLWIIQSHLFGLSGIQEHVDLDPWVRRSPSIPGPLWKTLLDRSFVDRFQRNPLSVYIVKQHWGGSIGCNFPRAVRLRMNLGHDV